MTKTKRSVITISLIIAILVGGVAYAITLKICKITPYTNVIFTL